MPNRKLRDIYEVNGWKVNHPHSAANVIYSLSAFIFAFFPLLFFFFPLISDYPVDFSTGLNGLAIIKFFVEFMKNAFSGPIDIPAVLGTNVYIAGVYEGVNDVLKDATFYMFVSIGGLLLVMSLFSFITIIISIVHFSKGYLRNAASVKRLSIVQFIFSVLIFMAFLFFFFAFRAETKMDLFVWLTAIPVGASLFFFIYFSIFHFTHFKDTILEKDLEVQDDEATVEHLTKVHEIRKVKYESSTTLPNNITSLGGHAFAENQSLIVANIPTNIDKIGPSAFANCLNLQVVSIPTSIKEIGFNCFFNCVELERINYAGTKQEWRKIRRGSNWLAKAGTSEVVCLDGTIIVNPYH